jgi:choline dehydrogenase-like flavoprotein
MQLLGYIRLGRSGVRSAQRLSLLHRAERSADAARRFQAGARGRVPEAMDPYRHEEINPDLVVKSDADIDAWLKKVVITAHHPAGTCAIGQDSVLDVDLKIHGIEGLRVCHASAMPDLVSARINACVLMMAEKGADLIRGRPPLPRAEAA